MHKKENKRKTTNNKHKTPNTNRKTTTNTRHKTETNTKQNKTGREEEGYALRLFYAKQ